MKYIRYQIKKDPPAYGWIHENKVGPILGDIFHDYRRMEASLELDQITLLKPVIPTKIICVGRNYIDHAREEGVEVPEIPLLFLKPPSAVIYSGESIILPPQSQQVEHEAELAVVIGKKARWIRSEQAQEYIFGYTIANDVTARDLQRRDGQWTRGKGFDTFCPIGPWIETEFDSSDAVISCKVNQELRQMASTREMVFTINQLIAFITSVMTMEPGDLILTGTPAGIGVLQHGDKVEVTIEGIGSIQNPVKSGSMTG
jgi:2-keto-4-pentenoate hydratase/2-oxohepta-3-ene-1,7-dioic acid hydratase in catechol pathway